MSASKKVYLFANWKMYLDYDESNILANAIAGISSNFAKKIKMVVFPSALSFYPVAQVLGDEGIATGAQNVHFEAKDVVEIQLRAALDGLKWKPKAKLFIAYEPVWAIGTGNNCDPIEAEKMCAMIEKMAHTLIKNVEVIVLYGGSVKGENIKEFMKQPNISGVLVGGASAKLDTWLQIVQNAC